MVGSVESPVSGGQRVGDEERQKVAEILADHHASGRLDDEVFEERLGAALTARTSRELGRLVADLPVSGAYWPIDQTPEQTDDSPAWRITISARTRRRTVAGTAAVGAIAGTIYAFAEHFQYATVEILISGGITGVVGLGIGRFLGWRAHLRQRQSREQ